MVFKSDSSELEFMTLENKMYFSLNFHKVNNSVKIHTKPCFDILKLFSS